MSKNIFSPGILIVFPLVIGIVGISGCAPTVAAFKYGITGQQAPPPPRTIEAAKAQFPDSHLIDGKTTERQLTRLLGSPAQIKKHNGKRTYVYLKSVATQGVSTDTGTIYVGEFTFNRHDRLDEKNYSARPMANPLTGG